MTVFDIVNLQYRTLLLPSTSTPWLEWPLRSFQLLNANLSEGTPHVTYDIELNNFRILCMNYVLYCMVPIKVICCHIGSKFMMHVIYRYFCFYAFFTIIKITNLCYYNCLCRSSGSGRKQQRSFIWSSWRRTVPLCLPRSSTLITLIKYKKNLISFIRHVRPTTPIKPQIFFASVIGLGCNTFLLYPRPITVAKIYLQFYRCHGPYMLDKSNKVFLRGRVIAYFLFSKWRPSAILDLVWHHIGPPTICVWRS